MKNKQQLKTRQVPLVEDKGLPPIQQTRSMPKVKRPNKGKTKKNAFLT